MESPRNTSMPSRRVSTRGAAVFSAIALVYEPPFKEDDEQQSSKRNSKTAAPWAAVLPVNNYCCLRGVVEAGGVVRRGVVDGAEGGCTGTPELVL